MEDNLSLSFWGPQFGPIFRCELPVSGSASPMKIGQNFMGLTGVIFRPEKSGVISPCHDFCAKGAAYFFAKECMGCLYLWVVYVSKKIFHMSLYGKRCVYICLYISKDKTYTSHISYVYYVYSRFLDPPHPYIPHRSLSPNSAPRKIHKQNSQLPTTPRVIFGV